MNTLFNQSKDFSGVKIGKVFSSYDRYLDFISQFQKKKIDPLEHAITFYYSDHFIMDMEKMFGESIPKEYEDLVADCLRTRYLVGIHMFYYLFLIVHREARYFYNNGKAKTFFELEDNAMYKPYFIDILGNSSGDAANSLLINSSYISDFDVVDFVRVIRDVFNNLSFSSSYGGKKWGDIAHVLYRFVSGEVSLNIMTDMAFALEHNTGNIFNKGVLYNSVDTNTMKKVLDVQRGGQIPNYVTEKVDAGWDVYMDKFIVNFHKRAVVIFPHYKEDLNWYKIEKAGSVMKYTEETNTSTTDTSKEYVVLYPGFVLNKVKMIRDYNALENYL